MLDLFDQLAVVPIFVNAGSALLPALLAPLAAAAANLLRPRELVRIIREAPLPFLAMLVILLAVVGGVAWWLEAPAAAARVTPTATTGTSLTTGVDWSREAILQMREGRVRPPATQTSGTVSGAVFFRSNAARTGADGSPAPMDLAVLWQRDAEEAATFLASPTVHSGRVYIGSCLVDLAGAFGTLYCLDANTGSVLWAQEKAGAADLKAFFSSPAVTADGKYVVVGQGLHEDKDCDLVCFEAQTGRHHWSVRTPLHIEGSPAIHGDIVVAGAGAIEGPNRRPLGDPGFVLAVRISDGKELWRYPLADPESSPVFGPDGTVYIGSGFNGNAVVALRSEDDATLKTQGRERLIWRCPAPYPVTNAVTLAGGLVIVGGGNSDYVVADPNPAGVVLAVDAATGVQRWSRPMPDAVLGAIAASDGKLICPVRNGRIVVLNLEDGAVIWEQPVSGSSPVLAGPAVAGPYIYAVAADGMLAVMQLADGKVVQRIMLNDPARPGLRGQSFSSPTLAGGVLYVGSETGGLKALTSGKGAP